MDMGVTEGPFLLDGNITFMGAMATTRHERVTLSNCNRCAVSQPILPFLYGLGSEPIQSMCGLQLGLAVAV